LEKLVRKFGVGNPLANRIVASVGSVIDDKQERDVRNFFKRNPLTWNRACYRTNIGKS